MSKISHYKKLYDSSYIFELVVPSQGDVIILLYR